MTIFISFFINSKIWTAFKAAPFKRLSETTQKFKIFFDERPCLSLETKTSSLPSTSIGVGNESFQTSTPSKLFSKSVHSSRSTSFSNTAEQKVP